MQSTSQSTNSAERSSRRSEASLLNSSERLQALRNTALLDTPPETAFDRLTALACRLLKASVSLVSLVDAERQFFKSAHGLCEPWAQQQGTPLSHSFCQYVVTSNAPLIVEDAREHPILHDNLAITDLNVIAYLGVPLRTSEGHNLGSLCVIDDKPHAWSSEDLKTLTELAELVMTEINVRQYLDQQQQIQQALEESNTLLQGVIHGSNDGIYVRDLEGRYLLVNEIGAAILGFTPQEMIGKKYSELFSAEIVAEIQEEDHNALLSGQPSRREQTWTIGQVEKIFHSTRSAYRDLQGNVIGILSVIHEITELKQTEEALRTSETNFRSLFESMTQGIVHQNAEGRIINANAAAENILGLTLEELQGRKSIDPLWRATRADGTDFPGEEHPSMVALRTGEVQRNVVMYIFNPRLNDVRCLRVDAIPQFRKGEKRPYQVYALFRDVTEQRRSNEKLAYHAQLLANMYDGVIATDNRFRITVWNRGAEQMYGWQAEEVMGQLVREVIQTEIDDTTRQQAIQELQATGRMRMEVITHHKDGSPVATEVITVTLTDGEGEITGYLSINRDIRERKATEAALQDSEERFRVTFEQAPVGIAHSNLEGKYIRVNHRLCEMLGYTRIEMLQKDLHTITHPDDEAISQQQMKHILAGDSPSYTIEKRYLRKDGSYLWVNVTVSVVRNLKTHAPEYFIRVIEDISERKRYEQELVEINATLEQRVAVRSRQLETSNSKLLESQTKLRLLSQQLMQMTEQERKRISREIHDQLGQSLTAIKMEVKAAQRRVNSDPAGVAARLHTADQMIDETVDTVRRIAADLRPGVLDHFGLGPAVEWQMEQFKQRNHIDYQLEITVDPKLITPDMATASFRILQEALTNVVRHAQASSVSVTLATNEREFMMKVQDNGCGLSEATSKRQSLGVLGMSERAQQLGGSVTLSGEPGTGALVTLTLPLQPTEEENKL
ncbi:MAG: PAS domain S-box protein [Caldilineaceae bacterium]